MVTSLPSPALADPPSPPRRAQYRPRRCPSVPGRCLSVPAP